MATASITSQDFVNVIALEVASKIDVAVESWMAEMELALNDPALTTLGRMNAAKDVLAQYKNLTGKQRLQSRKVLAA
ncbi:MAG TPA: hypothetical protein VLK33_16650 [Terriglobales bacterium]|nr:hypothetical protein [Terriglobales bacterium]